MLNPLPGITSLFWFLPSRSIHLHDFQLLSPLFIYTHTHKYLHTCIHTCVTECIVCVAGLDPKSDREHKSEWIQTIVKQAEKEIYSVKQARKRNKHEVWTEGQSEMRNAWHKWETTSWCMASDCYISYSEKHLLMTTHLYKSSILQYNTGTRQRQLWTVHFNQMATSILHIQKRKKKRKKDCIKIKWVNCWLVVKGLTADWRWKD